MLPILALLAALASQPVHPGPLVSVGTLDWDSLPRLQVRPGGDRDAEALWQSLRRIVASKKCTLPSMTADEFEFEARFAALVAPDGRVLRIVVLPLNCRPLEALVGAIAADPDRISRTLPPGGEAPVWMASKVSFHKYEI